MLQGRVVDLRGEGVPAAKVWITTALPPAAPVAQTIADGEGYFLLKAPRMDWVQVQASGEGTCRSAGFARRNTLAVRIEVHDGVTVRGVLRRRDGKPVKDVPVRAYPEGRVLHHSHADARTDDEGRFELLSVPLGPTRVVAWVDGEGLAEVEQRIAGDCDVALAPLTEPTTNLRIEVAGLPGAKATDASVRLLPYAKGGLRELPPPLGSSKLDASGVLELESLPDHEYRVSVYLDGFVLGPAQQTAKPKKGPHVLKFTATPAIATDLEWKATVAGPDDKPVEGVTFVMRAIGGGREARATSDAEGKLTFHCPLAVGSDAVVYSTDARWALDQRKDGNMHGSSDRRFLNAHECKVDPTSPLAMRVAPACSVKGRLLMPGGQPAAFVDVELEERRDGRWPDWMTMAWAMTDRDGNFKFARLHHLDDSVRVMVKASDGAAVSEPLAIATAGATVSAPDLQLAAPAIVEGVVLDAQQRPAPGVRVWLRDWDLATGQQRSGSITEVITDRQGRYRFLGAPPGGAYLNLLDEPGEQHGFDRACAPFEVERGKTHTIDLQLPAK
ncbi:MAG TPA: carboxypeptidase regulatory-like domain-containing protein [Planctomycetota bacterium]